MNKKELFEAAERKAAGIYADMRKNSDHSLDPGIIAVQFYRMGAEYMHCRIEAEELDKIDGEESDVEQLELCNRRLTKQVVNQSRTIEEMRNLLAERYKEGYPDGETIDALLLKGNKVMTKQLEDRDQTIADMTEQLCRLQDMVVKAMKKGFIP